MLLLRGGVRLSAEQFDHLLRSVKKIVVVYIVINSLVDLVHWRQRTRNWNFGVSSSISLGSFRQEVGNVLEFLETREFRQRLPLKDTRNVPVLPSHSNLPAAVRFPAADVAD